MNSNIHPRLFAGGLRCALASHGRTHISRTVLLNNTLQPRRNTMYFRRMYPVPLRSPNQTGPFLPKLRRREFVYIMEENTDTRPAGNMDVILATDVEGLGLKGDIVTVSKVLARTHMLPVGVADYVSPENMARYEQIRKERENVRRQTMTALKSMKELAAMTLPVPMSTAVTWTLNKTHVRVAFRAAGVELTDDCITLPEQPVTQHGNITVQITVNGMDKVNVKAVIYPYSKTVPASLPPVWSQDPALTRFDLETMIARAARRMRGLSLKEDHSTTAASSSC